MVDQNDNEFREFKRRHLIYYLEVFDDESGELIGHLVDLTVSGLQLVSREEIATGRNVNLRMSLPEECCLGRQVVFQAECMWSGPDVNPEFYVAGFSVPELSLEIRALFTDMIGQIGFND